MKFLNSHVVWFWIHLGCAVISLSCLLEYETERPLNAAAMFINLGLAYYRWSQVKE